MQVQVWAVEERTVVCIVRAGVRTHETNRWNTIVAVRVKRYSVVNGVLL